MQFTLLIASKYINLTVNNCNISADIRVLCGMLQYCHHASVHDYPCKYTHILQRISWRAHIIRRWLLQLSITTVCWWHFAYWHRHHKTAKWVSCAASDLFAILKIEMCALLVNSISCRRMHSIWYECYFSRGSWFRWWLSCPHLILRISYNCKSLLRAYVIAERLYAACTPCRAVYKTVSCMYDPYRFDIADVALAMLLHTPPFAVDIAANAGVRV